jgi:hypothetical protein
MSHAAIFGLIAGLGLALVAPMAAFAEVPTSAPATTVGTGHILGSGGLGSPQEPMIAPAPVVLPSRGHVMGSGGLGSPQEPTIVRAAEAAATGDPTIGVMTVDATLAARTEQAGR